LALEPISTVGDIDIELLFDFIVTVDAKVSGVSGCFPFIVFLGERLKGGRFRVLSVKEQNTKMEWLVVFCFDKYAFNMVLSQIVKVYKTE
jgi:hypothetical protein